MPPQANEPRWYDVAIMTQRTQITLDSEQHRKVRQRAAELGISMAEYLRRIIDRELAEPSPRRDLSAILALGDSGGSDIAHHKDEYVHAAIVASKRR
jgi:hypothetical protein